MMLELIPGSNAYATLDEAEGYMAALAYCEAWKNATEEQKIAAIVQAARWMGTLCWAGRKATKGQALAWPREGALDADGYEVDPASIPHLVKDANAEFAFRLLTKDRAGDAKKGVRVAGITTPDQERELVPQSVRDLLGCLLLSNNSIRLERG